MRRILNKKAVLIVSFILIFTVVAGTTLAYVFTDTDPIRNTFKSSSVSCAVLENGGNTVSGANVKNVTEKNDVKIKNTGDTAAYIRVAVVVNWTNEDGNRVWADSPKLGVDYIAVSGSLTNWFYAADGFAYYKKPVAPGAETDVLLSSVKLKDGVTGPVGTDGTQYYLSVEIVASAIQSTPASTVHNQWGVTVADDGTISKAAGTIGGGT